MKKSAILSADKHHRYTLVRAWDESKPVLTFVMLNPSTADADTDDATIRKCIGFAERLGFGSILVLNLFSFRARDPDTLKAIGFPGAGINDNMVLHEWLTDVKRANGTVVCAWGSNARHPVVARRAREVLGMIESLGLEPKALRILPDGIPSHPLMLPYTCTLEDL